MNVIPDISKEVLKVLHGTEKLGAAMVVREYLPEISDPRLQAGVTLIVVVPVGIESTVLTRGHDQDDVSIDVVLVKKLDKSGTEAQVDALLLVVQRINKALREQLGTDPPARRIALRSEPIYDVEKVKQHGMFFSVTRHTFRVLGAEPS